jgi:hypothetical protein
MRPQTRIVAASVALCATTVACGDTDSAVGDVDQVDTGAVNATPTNPMNGEFVDFNLDEVFSTPEGKQLAIDTSHTLTPAIVDHVARECDLSFGDEQHEPP